MKKNITVYLVCVCVYFIFKSNEKNAILFNEWKKKKKVQSGGLIGKKISLFNRSINFIYEKTTQQCYIKIKN